MVIKLWAVSLILHSDDLDFFLNVYLTITDTEFWVSVIYINNMPLKYLSVSYYINYVFLTHICVFFIYIFSVWRNFKRKEKHSDFPRHFVSHIIVISLLYFLHYISVYCLCFSFTHLPRISLYQKHAYLMYTHIICCVVCEHTTSLLMNSSHSWASSGPK